jgi:hypothetical protein
MHRSALNFVPNFLVGGKEERRASKLDVDLRSVLARIMFY